MSHRSSWSSVRDTIAPLLLTSLLSGCGIFGGDRNDEDLAPGEVTPTSSDVYIDNAYLHVRLEPQDGSGGPVPPNDHPAGLTAAQLETWLADMQVEPQGGDESITLIPEKLLPQLSIIVAQALGDARPDEDVVFHALRRAGSWFGAERRATTARVFYRDGALNLIFGDLDDFYSEHIDRSLQPLEPGDRDETSELSGEIVRSPGFAFVDGRSDWIRIDAASSTAAAPAPTPTAAAPAAPRAAAPVEESSQDPRWTQLEERLLILDGLRRKGLITDEDYETKKQELLEVLDL